MRPFFLFPFLLLLSLSNASEDKTIKKINNLNLLFPLIYESIESRSIEFTLIAYNGCYEWQSSRPEYLKIKSSSLTSPDSCQSQAVIALSSNKAYDNIIWIIAKDKDSGDVLKVESKISKIHKIEILTKLRTIDVGDVQVLEVLGYDPEENVFSTLEGLRFNWKIEQSDNILEFVPTKDSLIKSTETRKKIESQHFQSDIILVKGLRTGYVKVHISVNEKGYESINDVVSLIIIERFIIWPENNIYILPTTTVNFELAVIQNENHLLSLESKLFYDMMIIKFVPEIALPNKNYLWSSDDETLGIIRNSGVFSSYDKVGVANIIVNDIRISNNSARSSINIVEPWYMDLEICEYNNNEELWETEGINLNYYKPVNTVTFENNWNLIKNKVYYVRAVIYDQFKNRLLISKDAKIKFSFNHELFSVVELKNHEILVKPLKKIDKSMFSSKLIEVSQLTSKYIPKRTIDVEKSISIITQISLFKLTKLTILPYLSSLNKNQQNFYLKTIGGSSFYEFYSQNPNILTVDVNGMISSKSIGRTIVEVHDRKNFKNMDKMEVKIEKIDRLRFPESIKESFTNSNSFLDIIAFSQENLPFSNCTSLNFGIRTKELSPIFDYSLSNFNYEELQLAVNAGFFNKFYMENIGKFQQNHSKTSDYAHHVLDEDISNEQLNDLFRYYNNYGVCNRAIIQAKNQTGDQILHAYLEDDLLIDSDDVRLLVYNRFSLMNPLFKGTTLQKNKYEIILSYGSSFLWSFQGGPIQMEEKRSLQEKTSILQDSSQIISRELSIEKAALTPAMKNRKNFLVSCSKFKEYDEKFSVSFNSWNEPDHFLVNPVNASINIIVSCKIPKSFQIYLLKDDESFLDFNSIKLQSSNNIYVKNFENYDFQVWAFDGLNNAFYNFSSLEIKWSVTNNEYVTFENFSSTDLSPEICPFCLDEYSRIRIQKYSGDILLQASSVSYTTPSLPFFPKVSDDLLLTVAYNLETDSNRYTLYLHPENSLQIAIYFGSGSFKLTPNDTTLAHITKNGSEGFEVLPKALGTIKIEVFDEQMVKARVFICYVFIVRCHKAKITLTPAIFQEMDHTKVEIFMFDALENLIPAVQMKFVSFDLDVLSVTDISQKDLFRISKTNSYGQFLAQGLKAGNFRFMVHVENYIREEAKRGDEMVNSETDVYVYTKLTSIPNTLLLAPGCNCHIELVGGPSEKAKITSNIELKTRVSEETMIKLTKQEQNLFLVEGLTVGNGKIFFELVQKETKNVLSVYEVDLRIELVNHIEILGFPERKVFFGATFRLLALMKFNNMMFTASICPFEFFWTSQNRQILEVSVPSIENFLANPKLASYDKKVLENYHIGVNATAIGVGVAELNLLVKFNYPNPFPKQEKHIIEKIRILDYLYHSTPSFIRKSENMNSLLILPPKTEYQLKLNKDIERYNVRAECPENNFIEVNNHGILKTGEKKGKFTIVVEENNSSQFMEDESLYINVLVANIFSIFVENSYKLLKMPIEATSDLKIHFLDYYGRLFPSNIKHVKLQVHLSNTKIIDLRLNEDNSLLSIRGKMIGATICTIFLESNPFVFDMFLIIVDSIITPSSPVYLHEGGNVQFTVLSKNGDSKEKWFTNDNSIIELNQITGKAIALREGAALVLYKETIQYTTKINVFRINKLILDNKAPMAFTNIFESKHYREEYKILVRAFSDDYEIDEISNEKGPINNNLRFFCESPQSEWIFVSQEIQNDAYDKKHKLFCVVRVKKTYPTDFRPPKSIALIVNLMSNRENSFKIQARFNFEIYWAFKIPDVSKIKLSKKYNSFSMNIFTPYDLDVRGTTDIITKTIKSKFAPEKNEFTLNITIPPNYRTIEGTIILENLITNQTETLQLSYDPSADYDVPPKASTASSRWLLPFDGVIIALVLILIACYWFYRKNDKDTLVSGSDGKLGRGFDDPRRRKIGGMSYPYEGNRILSSPIDVIKTPADKRRSIQEELDVMQIKGIQLSGHLS